MQDVFPVPGDTLFECGPAGHPVPLMPEAIHYAARVVRPVTASRTFVAADGLKRRNTRYIT